MHHTKYIIAFVLILLITPYCQSQNKVIPPDSVEAKLNILYPHAINIQWYPKNPSDTVQGVAFDCNCPEGLGHIIMSFSLKGRVLSKDLFINKSDLPATIINYIENNYPNNFNYNAIEKIFSGNDVVGYKIEMRQLNADGTPATTGWIYILRFKASGEFISEDKK